MGNLLSCIPCFREIKIPSASQINWERFNWLSLREAKANSQKLRPILEDDELKMYLFVSETNPSFSLTSRLGSHLSRYERIHGDSVMSTFGLYCVNRYNGQGVFKDMGKNILSSKPNSVKILYCPYRTTEWVNTKSSKCHKESIVYIKTGGNKAQTIYKVEDANRQEIISLHRHFKFEMYNQRMQQIASRRRRPRTLHPPIKIYALQLTWQGKNISELDPRSGTYVI